MVIHQFDPVIYPYKVWVIIDKKPNRIPEKFKEYSGNPIIFQDSDMDRLEAFTMPVQSKGDDPYYGVILFFRSKRSMDYELVAHESSHAAKYLFEHIGADCNIHEPFEFVVGWISGCCKEVKNGKTSNQ